MEYLFAERFDGVEGSAIRAIFSLLGDPEIISFAGGNPSPKTFPADKLAGYAEKLIREQGDSVLQYGGTLGTADLLGQVQKLFEAEGLSPKKEELIILSGSSQGIDLLTKTLINPGDRIIVESPTFLGAIQTFKMYQADLIEAEMDEHGLIMEKLEKQIVQYQPKFIYTIPTFQNPTGRTLPAERRKQLAALAEKYGVIVLEDDPYAALRYAGEQQPSIKSFDRANQVVKLMSFSKTISPGLRVGAAYAPAEIIAKFNLGKQGQDVHTSNLTQQMVCEYIREGAYFDGIAANCAYYAGKLDAMYAAAEKYFPQGTKLVKPEGGMFLWAELPEGINATALFEEAVGRKVAYVPGTHFYAQGGHDNTLRLNYTMADEAEIEKGMQLLGELFTDGGN
ncbi:MAG: PLP-dependent aminotransferase family protein [Clostridiales bacterium]|nr:PLP-dependent aminotransferase family protein [Clostridiales bacterium]